MLSYQRCVDYWDDVFSQEDGAILKDGCIGNSALQEAIDWVCASTQRILDFGCGNGVMLMLCAYHGTHDHLGIDLSGEAIRCARRKAEQMPVGRFNFLQGGVSALAALSDQSFDAVILSNIVDNLYPDDANKLLAECARILKPGGKALLKLNPYITLAQIEEWGIKTIAGDLLDDGLLLWNQTTEQWRDLLEQYFTIHRLDEIYYPEHDQTNRLFLLKK